MARTTRSAGFGTQLPAMVGACLAGAVAAALAAVVVTLPLALGAEGTFEALASVFLLSLMIATIGVIPVALLVTVAIRLIRIRLHSIFRRDLLIAAIAAVAAAAVAGAMALIVASVMGIPAGAGNRVDVRGMMITSAAVGGVVVGVLLARSESKRAMALREATGGDTRPMRR